MISTSDHSLKRAKAARSLVSFIGKEPVTDPFFKSPEHLDAGLRALLLLSDEEDKISDKVVSAEQDSLLLLSLLVYPGDLPNLGAAFRKLGEILRSGCADGVAAVYYLLSNSPDLPPPGIEMGALTRFITSFLDDRYYLPSWKRAAATVEVILRSPSLPFRIQGNVAHIAFNDVAAVLDPEQRRSLSYNPLRGVLSTEARLHILRALYYAARPEFELPTYQLSITIGYVQLDLANNPIRSSPREEYPSESPAELALSLAVIARLLRCIGPECSHFRDGASTITTKGPPCKVAVHSEISSELDALGAFLLKVVLGEEPWQTCIKPEANLVRFP